MEAKLKHLEMIQGVITRMANNSFLLKGWSVLLLSALLALAAGSEHFVFAALAFFPCLSFWALDGFFLHQERLFRELYDAVAKTDPQNITFSMDTRPYTGQVKPWLRVCFSRTLGIFHGILLGAIATASAILCFLDKP
jgi:hypothetical protein